MAKVEHASHGSDDRHAFADDAMWFEGVINRGKVNNIYGTLGDDHLTGTSGKDHFRLQYTGTDGGSDIVSGGGGNDKFYFGMTYTDADQVNGGGGDDRLILAGTVDDNLVLGPANFSSVESITLTNGAYHFTLLDGIQELSIRGFSTHGEVYVDASALEASRAKLRGGGGEDTLIGGSGDDVLAGAGGPDVLTGGGGNDTFVYYSPVDSRKVFSGQPDLITDFSLGDRVILPTEIVHVESYHIGKTRDHVGDVIASYFPDMNLTTVDIFTDDDGIADMTILFAGDISDLSVRGDAALVLGGVNPLI